MKKIVGVLLLGAMLLSGCSANTINTNNDLVEEITTVTTIPATEQVTTTSKATTQATTTAATTAATTTTAETTTITTTTQITTTVATEPEEPSNYVAYDTDDIKITISDIVGTSSLTYEIENLGDYEISQSIRGVAVNGRCIGYAAPLYSVAPGRKAVEELDISGCEYLGISKVESIDILFQLSGDVGYDFPVVHIELTDDGLTDVFVPDGELVYSDDMIDVYADYGNSGFEDMEITYYNKTDIALSLSIMHVSANDVMLSGYATQIFNTVVPPDCYASMGGEYGKNFFWDYTIDEVYSKTDAPVEVMRGEVRIYSMTNEGVSYEGTTDEITIYEVR